ncbi:hypothetical protein GC167_03925 [bacterium]|nr:hypothetical protein [bacterium]
MSVLRFSRSVVVLATLAGWTTSCSKDDNKVNNPPNQNEEEVITTLIVRLEAPGGQPVDYAFRDPDGPGGASPTQWDTLDLQPNTLYACSLFFLNESGADPEDITPEIEMESDEHQVFYTPGLSGLTVTTLDVDGNGNPLGLDSEWIAAQSGEGEITITLKHQPGVKAPAPGDIALGSTDAEVVFQVRVD